jgi:general secretion pathway protein A
VLEEVRLLSGIETPKEKVLRIILAGQPELNDKLDSPELEQLAQRIRLRFHLPALTNVEMRAYILHRLEVAGSQGREIFANDTFELLFRYTGGVPRLTNTLCDTSMLAAANRNHDTVSRNDVLAAIEELQWQEYTSHTGTRLLRLRAEAPVVQSGGTRAKANNEESAPLARILLASAGRTVSERALYPGRLIIGRTSANDLQIESRFVSRHHCQIVTTAQSCVIEDLNSTNGIFLHSKRVRHHNLNDGDVVMIGQHELLYVDERAHQRTPGEPHAASAAAGDQAVDTGS